MRKMTKLTLFFVCISFGLFGSSQSTSLHCSFSYGGFGTLYPIYVCHLMSIVNMTSPDAAQVDGISGLHHAGFNNDDVGVFHNFGRATMHYFPSGLDKMFKNLRAIQIMNSGLKKVHVSDLKPFHNLVDLCLFSNELEVLEENLFEFNPNLEYINLNANKITYIDPNVFDKLTKLRILSLAINPCIDMYSNSPTGVQNIIKTAKLQCTNSDYLNYKQKVNIF
ncbi:hypothetical protein ACKWTF_012697 [Chironomus riparius]